MNMSGSAGRAYVASLNHSEIKQRYVNDLVSMKQLSVEYGVHCITIRRMLTNMYVKIRPHTVTSKIQGYRQKTGMILICDHCGNSFYRNKAYAKRGKMKFCSQTCHVAHVENNIERQCEYCGKNFRVPDHWRKKNTVRFCSTNCYHAWQKKRSIVELKCDQCGKDFTKKRGRYNQVKGDKHFCSLRCSQDYRGRENHHNWKGGITPLVELIRGHSKSHRWIKAVFKRDNYTCQECGVYGADINCHHQRSFSTLLEEFLAKHNKLDLEKDKQALLRRAVRHKPFFDVANGVTLCTVCHDKIHEDKKVE